MIRALEMELYKTRRKRLWLVVGALIAVQIAWSLWGIRRMDAHDLQEGWLFTLYQFPLLNSILLPVIAAVIASRLSDMEHKGQTLKLIETLQPAGRLFNAKFITGCLYLLAATLLQIAIILATGFTCGFVGNPPLRLFAGYLLFSMAVGASILLLQQVLSLLFANQMVSLAVGLIGSFFGLFSMYFPPNLAKVAVWGYYGVLMFIRMDWNPATRVTHFYEVPVDWVGAALLAAHFCLIYAIGRAIFVRKEL